MKKLGFTLAETLITLGIVGIVSALTIPTLVSNNQNKINASKLASAIPAVENAFTTMMATEGVQDFAETEFAQNYTTGNSILSKYTKIIGSNSLSVYYENLKPFKNINSKNVTSVPSKITYQLKNGATILLSKTNREITEAQAEEAGIPITTSSLELRIDVNGKQEPNVIGRDLFSFLVGSDGHLYPIGSLTTSWLIYKNEEQTYSTINSKLPCAPNKRSSKEKDNVWNFSEGCTARLVEKNFIVDY